MAINSSTPDWLTSTRVCSLGLELRVTVPRADLSSMQMSHFRVMKTRKESSRARLQTGKPGLFNNIQGYLTACTGTQKCVSSCGNHAY